MTRRHGNFDYGAAQSSQEESHQSIGDSTSPSAPQRSQHLPPPPPESHSVNAATTIGAAAALPVLSPADALKAEQTPVRLGMALPTPPVTATPRSRKRTAPDDASSISAFTGAMTAAALPPDLTIGGVDALDNQQHVLPPPAKKGRTNTPWTPEEEHRLKSMREEGKGWSEIAEVYYIPCKNLLSSYTFQNSADV